MFGVNHPSLVQAYHILHILRSAPASSSSAPSTGATAGWKGREPVGGGGGQILIEGMSCHDGGDSDGPRATSARGQRGSGVEVEEVEPNVNDDLDSRGWWGVMVL